MKALLIIVIALNLNAFSSCSFAEKSYKKDSQYLRMAIERRSTRDIKLKSKAALRSIEMVIVECNLTDDGNNAAYKSREMLMKINSKFEK